MNFAEDKTKDSQTNSISATNRGRSRTRRK